MAVARAAPRAFAFRRGIHLDGTVLSFEAAAGRGLTLLPHADAPRPRGGRRLLVTETTLALMGRAGEAIRRSALVAEYGHPFGMGDLRVELFPSGYLPGAAALWAETPSGPAVYAGSVRPGEGWLGTMPLEARPATSLYLDATFGTARLAFPPREEAMAAIVDWVRATRGGDTTPVLLTPAALVPDVAAALAAVEIPVRAHREGVARLQAYRRAGIAAPIAARVTGTPGDVVLWPPVRHDAPQLQTMGATKFLLVSPWAADPERLRAAGTERGVALSTGADLATLLSYAQETGASEVAVRGTFAEEAAMALRRAGHDAHVLGPPRQMPLGTFAST